MASRMAWLSVLFFSISFNFSVDQARAQDTSTSLNYNIRQNYVSPRALGMGNAFIAVADDYDTMWYNPAGLARLKEGEINLKLQAGATPEILKFTKDVQDALSQPEATKVDSVTNVISNNFGKDYWLRPTIGGTWARPYFGIGFIPVDSSVDLSIHQQLGPTLNVEAYQDSTLAMAFAKSYGEDDLLSLGLTVKAVYRGYVGKAVQASELVVNSDYFSKQDAKEGLSVDADIGALYVVKPPQSGFFSFTKWVKPTFGAVLRNAADYGFKSNFHLIDKNSGEPPKLGRRGDLGIKLETDRFWVFKPQFTIDEKDIGHPYWTFMKGLHVGAELLWDVAWWLRGGYRIGFAQGYISAGISAQFSWFRLDAATWGEELGTDGAKKQNRRYILQASLDF